MKKWVCPKCGMIYYGWSRRNICCRCGFEGKPDKDESERDKNTPSLNLNNKYSVK